MHFLDQAKIFVRAALERKAKQMKEEGKQQTADDTVDRLLDRF